VVISANRMLLLVSGGEHSESLRFVGQLREILAEYERPCGTLGR
jgi:hypothetical protein